MNNNLYVFLIFPLETSDSRTLTFCLLCNATQPYITNLMLKQSLNEIEEWTYVDGIVWKWYMNACNVVCKGYGLFIKDQV